MVSAWATENQLMLGQRKVDDKSYEITAIHELLKLLEVKGCIVMLYAIGTQTKIAKTIIEQGGDYILAVKDTGGKHPGIKENQGHLYEDIHDPFADNQQFNDEGIPRSYAKVVNKDHGRIEIRQCWTISDPEYLSNIRDFKRWEGIQTLVMILSERRIGDKSEVQDRYFISSLEGNAEKILRAKRSYWSIENRLHWVLDMAFNEDRTECVRIMPPKLRCLETYGAEPAQARINSQRWHQGETVAVRLERG